MGKLYTAEIPGLLKRKPQEGKKYPLRYSDGDGLVLSVWALGKGAWIARLQSNGKRRDYGLGNVEDVTLTEAREKCRVRRKALRDGRDPMTVDKPHNDAVRLFRDVAKEFIEAKISSKGRTRALGRLELHAFPKLGGLQLQSMTVERLTECLKPIWTTKPETARKVRTLIIRTVRYGLPNGATITSGLAQAVADRLPEQPKGKNFAALEYARVPELMSRLAGKGGMGALATRLSILTAIRSQEVRGAEWREIDFDGAVWTVPAERTKMKREHRVPLSPQALAVIEEAAAMRRAGTEIIFPSAKDRALSDMTLTKCLRDLGIMKEQATHHGMRATFKTWARERTSFADEISEACLAHQVSGDVRRRYLRTDFFDERCKLMDAWGCFCAGSDGAEVVQLRA